MISSFTLKREWETQMKRSRFLHAWILSFCLIIGYGVLGCGDEETVATIELEQVCALALEDMNSQGCRDTAYARIEDFTVCFRVCDGDTGCMGEECGDLGGGLGECTGDLQFLVAGPCGDCYTDCYLDFVGDGSGCLYNPGDPEVIGTECLDDLYTCVNGC
jgi:hypothetical protein